jgi:hypothetical protein
MASNLRKTVGILLFPFLLSLMGKLRVEEDIN